MFVFKYLQTGCFFLSPQLLLIVAVTSRLLGNRFSGHVFGASLLLCYLYLLRVGWCACGASTTTTGPPFYWDRHEPRVGSNARHEEDVYSVRDCCGSQLTICFVVAHSVVVKKSVAPVPRKYNVAKTEANKDENVENLCNEPGSLCYTLVLDKHHEANAHQCHSEKEHRHDARAAGSVERCGKVRWLYANSFPLVARIGKWIAKGKQPRRYSTVIVVGKKVVVEKVVTEKVVRNGGNHEGDKVARRYGGNGKRNGNDR